VSGLIAVTGATGGLGGRVARRLAERGVEQRLVVRDPARAPQLAGAEVVGGGSYADRAGMTAALRGADTLYLVSAAEDADRVALHTAAIDAAVDAGISRIVYASFLAAAADSTFTFARDHYATEQHIRATGVDHTFLRNSLYLDFAPLLAGPDGVIRGPADDGRVAWIARDDSADAAVTVLTADGAHDGRTYDLTGPESHTMAWTAEQLSRAAGREVIFVDETMEEAFASRAGADAQPYEIEGWVTSYAAIGTGELDIVSDDVERLTGHRAMTLPEFLERYPDSVAHLR
jgi:uncharacterized protein YbjT (DUF2867 family)